MSGRILVVDDEEKIRLIIRKYGEFEGYEIDEAANGMEAVEKCQKQDYDLLIMDVIDSGEGIAAQDIPYVWDRYYKGDKARKRLVSGTGLGLSIVQKILELHGATYGVESKPGMGADFWFAFEIVEK